MHNSSNQDSRVRKPTVPKVTQYRQESTFPWHTSATCPECAPIRLVCYRWSHVTLLGLLRIQHGSEKYGEKHGFGVSICVSLHKWGGTKMGCSVIQLLAKVTRYPQISHFSWTTRAQSRMCSAVPRALQCCLYSLMKHLTSVWIHTGKAKHTPNSMLPVIFKALYTLDLKLRSAAMWSKCAQSHVLCTRNWHKSLNCPECAQLSLM